VWHAIDWRNGFSSFGRGRPAALLKVVSVRAAFDDPADLRPETTNGGPGSLNRLAVFDRIVAQGSNGLVLGRALGDRARSEQVAEIRDRGALAGLGGMDLRRNGHRVDQSLRVRARLRRKWHSMLVDAVCHRCPYPRSTGNWRDD
jgi:hypothetical protein